MDIEQLQQHNIDNPDKKIKNDGAKTTIGLIPQLCGIEHSLLGNSIENKDEISIYHEKLLRAIWTEGALSVFKEDKIIPTGTSADFLENYNKFWREAFKDRDLFKFSKVNNFIITFLNDLKIPSEKQALLLETYMNIFNINNNPSQVLLLTNNGTKTDATIFSKLINSYNIYSFRSQYNAYKTYASTGKGKPTNYNIIEDLLKNEYDNNIKATALFPHSFEFLAAA